MLSRADRFKLPLGLSLLQERYRGFAAGYHSTQIHKITDCRSVGFRSTMQLPLSLCWELMADIAKYIEKADKYLQRGKAEDALAELKNALDEEPENILVRERACDICISLNRQREATN